MAPRSKLPSNIESLLEIDLNIFQKVVTDLSELYKLGRFAMSFIGSAYGVTLASENEEILIKKYNLERKQFNKIIFEILNTIHNILCNEIEQISKKIPEVKLKNFNDRVKIVSDMMEKNPSIRKSFYIYNSSKMPFFKEISWETEIKVFQSPSTFLKETPVLQVGRIKIGLNSPEDTPPTTLDFSFEIGEKDLENLIRSLDDMRNALKNLDTLNLAPKKAD